MTRQDIENICLAVVSRNPSSRGLLFEVARGVVEALIQAEDFRTTLLCMFYRVGIVGLKTSSDSAPSWSDDLGQAVTSGQITETTGVVVSPKYATALGV